MTFQTTTLNKILEIIGKIVKISADGDYIYRGEPECHEKVTSTLYRQLTDLNLTHLDIEEVQQDEVEKAKQYTNETDEFKIKMEIQHFGGKTNLIDFTEDYIIALFFAANGSPDKDGRVILQDINRDVKHWIREIPGREPESRPGAQKSIFIEPPDGFIPNDFIKPDEKIVIPKDLKHHILQYIEENFQTSAQYIYHDIPGFISSQVNRWSAYSELDKGEKSQDKGDETTQPGEKVKHYQSKPSHLIAQENAMQELNHGFDDAPYKHRFAYGKQTTLPQQDTAEEYNARGISHTKNGEFDLAIAAFRKAIKINPDYAEAHCNIGIVYECKGEYYRAIEIYTEVIQHDPNCVEAYNNRGIVYGEKGEFDLAIKDFNKAIELKKHYAKAYNNRGAVYRAKGENDRAVEDCSEAIQLDPYYADPYSNRGAAYRNKGEVNLAIEDYDKAIKLNPDFFVAYYNRGIAYQEKHDYDLAIEDYNKAIELMPKHAHPYNNRGNTYLLKGDSENAIKDYNKAIELSPELAVAYYNRGEARLNQQEWRKAKTDLIKAKDLGLDIAAVFRNGYKNVEAFEQKHKIALPKDIAVLVRQGFRYRYPMEEKFLNSEGKPLESPEVLNLLKEFRKTNITLGEYVKIEPCFGIGTVPTEVFVVDRKTRDELIAEHPLSIDILKPFLQGQDIRRWHVETQNQWLILTYRGIEINNYLAILQYLKKYRDALDIKSNEQEWYELPISLDEVERFDQPKLVCPSLYNRQTFAVETQGLYCGHTCYIIPTEEKWLCGLLNTLAVEWFYSQVSKQLHSSELEAHSDYIKQIPIPNVNTRQKDLVRKLVDYLIYFQKQPTINNKDLADSRDFAVFRYFEWIINGLVYEFYMPDVLKNADRDIFKHLIVEQFPEIDEIPGDKMSVFRSLYEHLHDRNHPVRVNLLFQDSLRQIRIIEGKW